MNIHLPRHATFLSVVVALVACSDEQSVPVVDVPGPVAALNDMDPRTPVPLQPMMAWHQKQNMQQHLVAIRRIVAGLASDDWQEVSEGSALIGSSPQMQQMCEHMGAGADGFTELALDFHSRADAIGVAARAHDAPAVLRATSHTLAACTSCHATYRQDVVDAGTWQTRTGALHEPMPAAQDQPASRPAAGAESNANPAPVIQLFNGVDLAGWHADVPAADTKPDLPPAFVVRDGLLVSQGEPQGHLITDEAFADYRLVVEYRWPGEPGNCGVLVHASKPRRLYGMFPQSIECQMHAGNAGDFWCIGEDIKVPEMEKRRGPRESWGVDGKKNRRIKNLTDDSEKPPGEWNEMVIECRDRTIRIWLNGDLVNDGFDCTADHGQIAIQAEGAACEFRKLELTSLSPK